MVSLICNRVKSRNQTEIIEANIFFYEKKNDIVKSMQVVNNIGINKLHVKFMSRYLNLIR